MDKEIWKEIEGYSGYQVSNLGRVRSNRGIRTGDWYELRPSLSVLGQARVTLFKDRRPKTVVIARLVIMAFVKKDIKDYVVRHYDSDPMNNRLDNLCVFFKRNQSFRNLTFYKEPAVYARDLPGEKWKEILIDERKYAVSNLGRVKNLWQRRKNPILRQNTATNGYKYVLIRVDGKQKMHLTHRLVAYCFCKKPTDFHEQSNRYYQVNHKDENPSNNRADNLEWVTAKENINYGHHNERIAKALGTEVWQYDLEGNYVGKFISISSAAKAMGKKDAEIRIKECLDDSSTTVTSYGYYWRLPNQPLKKIYGVIQCDMQGRVVAKYRSMAIAARATGAKLASICRVTKGTQETAVGYIWKRAWVSPTECVSENTFSRNARMHPRQLKFEFEE